MITLGYSVTDSCDHRSTTKYEKFGSARANSSFASLRLVITVHCASSCCPLAARWGRRLCAAALVLAVTATAAVSRKQDLGNRSGTGRELNFPDFPDRVSGNLTPSDQDFRDFPHNPKTGRLTSRTSRHAYIGMRAVRERLV